MDTIQLLDLELDLTGVVELPGHRQDLLGSLTEQQVGQAGPQLLSNVLVGTRYLGGGDAHALHPLVHLLRTLQAMETMMVNWLYLNSSGVGSHRPRLHQRNIIYILQDERSTQRTQDSHKQLCVKTWAQFPRSPLGYHIHVQSLRIISKNEQNNFANTVD